MRSGHRLLPGCAGQSLNLSALSSSPRYRMRLIALMLCLLLAVGVVIVGPWSSTPAPSRVANHAPVGDVRTATVSKHPPSAVAEDESEGISQPQEPIRITTEGTVRLQQGETAVLGYWDLQPGMNGIVLVTPQSTSDGLVALGVRLLEIPDRAVDSTRSEDLLPDIFGEERFDSLKQPQLADLLRGIGDSDDSRLVHLPVGLTEAGRSVSFRSVIRHPLADEDDWLGFALDLRASSLADNSGGFDLDIALDRRGVAEDAE